MENWRIFAVDGKRCAARRRGKRRRQSINRGDTRVDGFTEIFVVKGLDFKEAAPIQRERLLTVRENSGRREARSGSRESPLAITIEEYFSRWDSWNGRTEGKFSKQSGWEAKRVETRRGGRIGIIWDHARSSFPPEDGNAEESCVCAVCFVINCHSSSLRRSERKLEETI